jgi:hypothetical protein
MKKSEDKADTAADAPFLFPDTAPVAPADGSPCMKKNRNVIGWLGKAINFAREVGAG